MKVNEPQKNPQQSQQPPISGEGPKPAAWEEIETGRYRPRRIRGSLLGRELG